MRNPLYHVLFLCTGNSARSILAEAILNKSGAGRFVAYSAGSHPRGAVHPLALDLLRRSGFDTSSLQSKSWEVFSGPSAPRLDFVFTVCGSAANERCPVWPGQPMTAHWGVEDPSAVEPEYRERAFRNAFIALEARIQLFTSLPIASLDRIRLQQRLNVIGQTESP